MSNSAQELWSRSEAYHNSFLVGEDPVLEANIKNTFEKGVPADIAVSPGQGKLLYLFAKSIGAKRVLEVGTLGGYSTTWLARALPDDGQVVTFELSQHHADVASENIANAGLASKVKIIVGPAADNLAALSSTEKFDLAFIDADKESNVLYFKEAKRLVRPGGVVIVDNVVREGQVADPDNNDSRVEGVRKLLRELKDDKDVEATTIATVGEKGYDGFVYARLRD